MACYSWSLALINVSVIITRRRTMQYKTSHSWAGTPPRPSPSSTYQQLTKIEVITLFYDREELQIL